MEEIEQEVLDYYSAKLIIRMNLPYASAMR